jgi:hypothetical protein
MRSPWINLLFLHGHITPSALSWRVDAPPCGCTPPPDSVAVDVAELPLPAESGDDCARCA